MLKKTFISLLFLFGSLKANTAEYLNFENLITIAQENGTTDYIPHFRRLFNTMKINGMIECGSGYSTKYFIDHATKVASIDFMTPGTSDVTFLTSLKLFKTYKNWIPLVFNADLKNESFNNACAYQCSVHRNYALIDPRYLNDLDKYFKIQIDNLRKKQVEVDVALIHPPGIYLRGDMVNLFLARNIAIVIAHDTSSDVGTDVDEGYYGWFKVHTPPHYEKISIKFGVGTTFWIRKDYPEVIESMKIYAQRIEEYQKNGTLNYCTNPQLLAEIADTL